MPNRDIGTPRDAISRSNGTIGTSLPSVIGTARNYDLTRGITSAPLPNAPSESDLATIRSRIQSANYFGRFGFDPFGAVTSISDTATAVANIPKNTFETLADALAKGFGSAVYNPPLQQQSYGYGSTGGTNWGILLLIGAIGIGVYFYFKNR